MPFIFDQFTARLPSFNQVKQAITRLVTSVANFIYEHPGTAMTLWSLMVSPLLVEAELGGNNLADRFPLRKYFKDEDDFFYVAGFPAADRMLADFFSARLEQFSLFNETEPLSETIQPEFLYGLCKTSSKKKYPFSILLECFNDTKAVAPWKKEFFAAFFESFCYKKDFDEKSDRNIFLLLFAIAMIFLAWYVHYLGYKNAKKTMSFENDIQSNLEPRYKTLINNLEEAEKVVAELKDDHPLRKEVEGFRKDFDEFEEKYQDPIDHALAFKPVIPSSGVLWDRESLRRAIRAGHRNSTSVTIKENENQLPFINGLIYREIDKKFTAFEKRFKNNIQEQLKALLLAEGKSEGDSAAPSSGLRHRR